jgi:hypothetical protein
MNSRFTDPRRQALRWLIIHHGARRDRACGKKLPPGAFLVPLPLESGLCKDAATAPRSLTPCAIGFHCRQMLETMP